MIKGLQGREASEAVRRAVPIDSIEPVTDQELADEFRELLERSRGDVTGDLNELSSLGLALAQAGLVDQRPKTPIEHEMPQESEDGAVKDDELGDESSDRHHHDTIAVEHEGDCNDDTMGTSVVREANTSDTADKGPKNDLSASDRVDHSGADMSSPREQELVEEVQKLTDQSDTTLQSVGPQKYLGSDPVSVKAPAHKDSADSLFAQQGSTVQAASADNEVHMEAPHLSFEGPKNEGSAEVVGENRLDDSLMAEGSGVMATTAEASVNHSFAAHGSLSNEGGSVRAAQASIQMAILRQAFDAVRGNSAGVVEPGSKSSSAPMQGLGAVVGSQSGKFEGQPRASKPLSRAAVNRMLEKVEVAMKEAARTRDGKTIRFRVEPLNLGEVKVDVSLREGALHARLRAESPQVMSALRDRAHELQAALRKLGLDVDTVAVTVSGEENQQFSTSGGDLLDGKSFQEEGNNLPGYSAQVVENTFGSELADVSGADTPRVTDAILDHWVA